MAGFRPADTSDGAWDLTRARSRRVWDTETIHVFGVDCLCVNLDTLIRLKRAEGRRKDLEAIAKLGAIREERDKTGLR